MSVLTDLIYSGADTVAGLADNAVKTALSKYGADKEISLPGTAYFFPVLYGLSGIPVRRLGDLPAGVAFLKSLITNEKTLDMAQKAGLASLLGAEILESLKYLDKKAEGNEGDCFLSDDDVRTFASPLTAGDYPGCAVILGRTEETEDLLQVIRNYQRKGIVTFLVGSCIDQCVNSEIPMGAKHRVIPLRREAISMVQSVSSAVRAAMILGGVAPGDEEGILRYTAEKVPVFVNTFGRVDAIGMALICGALALGFPTVMDIDLSENQIPGKLESVCNHADTVKKSLNLAGVKIRVKELLNWAMENEESALAAQKQKPESGESEKT